MGGASNILGNAASWVLGKTADLAGIEKPKPPALPEAPPPAPEMQDESIRNAKLMERRRQLGMAGRGSTWLTGARGDVAPVSTARKTLLGS